MCIDFLFSLSVEFSNHVNKFCAQYKLYVFKDLKVRNKFEMGIIRSNLETLAREERNITRVNSLRSIGKLKGGDHDVDRL